jgi:hypothetical protein
MIGNIEEPKSILWFLLIKRLTGAKRTNRNVRTGES